jgi:hypothetical protein
MSTSGGFSCEKCYINISIICNSYIAMGRREWCVSWNVRVSMRDSIGTNVLSGWQRPPSQISINSWQYSTFSWLLDWPGNLQNWPKKSPDLNITDFHVWGYMKNLVSKCKVHTHEDLICNNVIVVTYRSDLDTLHPAMHSVVNWPSLCTKTRGHFQPPLQQSKFWVGKIIYSH